MNHDGGTGASPSRNAPVGPSPAYSLSSLLIVQPTHHSSLSSDCHLPSLWYFLPISQMITPARTKMANE